MNKTEGQKLTILRKGILKVISGSSQLSRKSETSGFLEEEEALGLEALEEVEGFKVSSLKPEVLGKQEYGFLAK